MTGAGPIRLGVVTAFDGPRGLGGVTDDVGVIWPFHCTQIADGTRDIDVGSSVAFCAVPGALGRMEAARIVKLAAPA